MCNPNSESRLGNNGTVNNTNLWGQCTLRGGPERGHTYNWVIPLLAPKLSCAGGTEADDIIFKDL
jgi:hypothetical protein